MTLFAKIWPCAVTAGTSRADPHGPGIASSSSHTTGSRCSSSRSRSRCSAFPDRSWGFPGTNSRCARWSGGHCAPPRRSRFAQKGDSLSWSGRIRSSCRDGGTPSSTLRPDSFWPFAALIPAGRDWCRSARGSSCWPRRACSTGSARRRTGATRRSSANAIPRSTSARCAPRGRWARLHVGRERGRDRSLPPPGSAGLRRGDREPGGPAPCHAAPPGRRPGAIHRPARPEGTGAGSRPGVGVGARPSRPGRRRRRAGWRRGALAAHLPTPVPGGAWHHAARVAEPPARAGGATTPREHPGERRRGDRRRRLRHRPDVAAPLPPHPEDIADGLPKAVLDAASRWPNRRRTPEVGHGKGSPTEFEQGYAWGAKQECELAGFARGIEAPVARAAGAFVHVAPGHDLVGSRKMADWRKNPRWIVAMGVEFVLGCAWGSKWLSSSLAL